MAREKESKEMTRIEHEKNATKNEKDMKRNEMKRNQMKCKAEKKKGMTNTQKLNKSNKH